ncbi:MAG: DEAD/DEAH box helicase family protein [Verrucomicrobiales bacterium]|nr:DEAD/DEAH box helicase family protein [Verrucomicrobiales bacterium]
MTSPFLKRDPSEWLVSNDLAFAIKDGFPVSPGHTLVVTKRIVATWFDASPAEQAAVMSLVNQVQKILNEEFTPPPDGFNVGFNSGEAAGQTVPHLHIHVIPRFHGDMDDPRGGVRHVIPDKGNYLSAGNKTRESGPSNGVSLSTGYPDDPLWERLAKRIVGARTLDILASFIQMSGLNVIESALFPAIRQGAQVRILFGDYLYISDPEAVSRLFGWTNILSDEMEETRLDARLLKMASLPPGTKSFHPKAWRLIDESGGMLVVGSSNLSKAALIDGVEWNVISETSVDNLYSTDIQNAFEKLWELGTVLDEAVVAGYSELAAKSRSVKMEPEAEDTIDTLPEPRRWQQLALVKLQDIRSQGFGRALVSVATGLGKTWLAGLDVARYFETFGRSPRVIVIAHRAEILAQNESVIWSALSGSHENLAGSRYLGAESDLSGNIVIASIQKLSRPEGLAALDHVTFDYAIIDEVHHAEAPTYQKVLARLQATFILGLTATPERADGVNISGLFDDILAYHASIGDGISEGSLVPFHYIGLKDEIDFQQIPWRNGRFDAGVLEEKVENSQRMNRLWKAWQEHPAEKTIIFCCSRRHAAFSKQWLHNKGVTAAAIFSGEGSDPRAASITKFERGEISTICVVDLFNEGFDVPKVDRVIFLRPTESKVIFTQQLGRGLRASEGKARLIVIDFVGNHRIFARRMLHLLSLTGREAGWTDLRDWLTGDPPSLPEKCLVDVELEARDLLQKYLPQGGGAAEEAYRASRDENGARPTMSELFHSGYLPSTMRARHNSWYRFVKSEGDLNEREQATFEEAASWFEMLETTSLTKCYKMVVLRVLLETDSLWNGLELADLSARCRRYLLRNPVLRYDLTPNKEIPDHEAAPSEKWTAWWYRMPVEKWLKKQAGRRWFSREDDIISFIGKCGPDLRETFEKMTGEIVDYRLAQYVKSRRLETIDKPGDLTFLAKVSHSSGKPILFLDRTANPEIPTGPTSVTLPNGETWTFRFVKIACNVAHPEGETDNRLSDLLREWFGENAGLPGTNFQVEFFSKAGSWTVKPVGLQALPSTDQAAIDLDEKTEIPSLTMIDFPSDAERFISHVPVYELTAAAGTWGPDHTPSEIGWTRVEGQKISEGMFVAYVSGHSMEPRIPAGSHCLFRPCPVGSREGRILLVQLQTSEDPENGGRFTVKKYHAEKQETEAGWTHTKIELKAINRDYSPIVIDEHEAEEMYIIGEFVEVLR